MGLVPQKQTVAKTAASFVVSTDAADGDYTDIATAITALGTAGGTLYLRKGTFSLSTSTISFPAGGHFRIIGAGRESTILDFAAGGASLWNPGVADQEIVFENLHIKGNSGANQRVLADAFGACVMFRNCKISLMKTIVNVSHANSEVHFVDCEVEFPNLSGTRFWVNSTDGGGEMRWEYVEVTVSTIVNTVDWIGDSPEWTVINSYVGGGGPINNRIHVGKANIKGLVIDSADMEFDETDNYISDLQALNTGVSIFLGAHRSHIVDSKFTVTIDFGGNGTFGVVSINANDCHVQGNFFNLNDVGASVAIDISDTNGTRCNIVGNIIRQFGFHGIRAGADKCVIRGNVFDMPVGASSCISDTTSDGSDYGGNTGINDETFLNISTQATNLAYDGIKRKRVSGGTTTGVFVSQARYTHEHGVVGVGTIKNTGGVNSMTVRETVHDLFNDSVSVDTVVAPGASHRLDPTIDLSTAHPPYDEYEVLVQQLVAATTFDLEMGMIGH